MYIVLYTVYQQDFSLPLLAVWLGVQQAILFFMPYPFGVVYVQSEKALFQSLFSICPFPFSHCLFCPLLPNYRSNKASPIGSHVRRHCFCIPVHQHRRRSRSPYVIYVPVRKGQGVFIIAAKSRFQRRSTVFVLG